ncbi:MAG: hypothetical protein IJ325_00770 [Clostridia bacterium]|nr:hypothetical protein [Clostridia bacterium]
MVKNTDSPLFEEAYFILRRSSRSQAAVSESEMAAEANRIVQDVYGFSSVCRRAGNGLGTRIMAFILGAAASSALIGSAALILALV